MAPRTALTQAGGFDKTTSDHETLAAPADWWKSRSKADSAEEFDKSKLGHRRRSHAHDSALIALIICNALRKPNLRVQIETRV